ncbi:serine protease [Umezawaea sp. Da 62-37]|uniref:S1 family peptidase n=1 Tax=Umezawaea sp. Da 62-37 TaxID=3075927 RepID=UPI0028F6C822|nr:serine protease [Umezawaea sp. Da 62-37]WNV85472.1 serine protease [Umezawaea sp. Da 62-37]
MGLGAERHRWRVRLHDDAGRVLGAGTMLDEWHLLTCAHVVDPCGGPEARVMADFVGLRGAADGRATVVAGGWVPETEDERGDIALLRLEEPAADVRGAPLHRMSLRAHQLVRAYGFPAGADAGLWSFARIAGEGGPGCEWMQLNKTADAEPIESGFSGTAVLDEATGAVVGMIVGRYKGGGGRVSWMIPVETMLGHLPRLREWSTGEPAVDESFVRPSGAADMSFMRQLRKWLSDPDSGAVWVVVTGGEESATAKALRLAVVHADRERSFSAPRLPDGAGDPPPAGAIDLALDASGKTADQVSSRIETRLDLSSTRPARNRTVIVVDGIDDAAEPERLVREVLAPLAGRADRLGLRLVLVFRRESSPGVTVALSLPGVSRTDLGGRLDALTGDVDELAEIEEYQATVAGRLTGVTMVPPRANRLRAEVNLLRATEAKGDLRGVARHLAGRERSVDKAVEDGRRLRADLDRRLARRAELRARLDGYAEMALNHGRVEDPELDLAYGRAWEALFVAPCDLEAAERALNAYAAAVHRRSGGHP